MGSLKVRGIVLVLFLTWPISALPSEIGDWFKEQRVPGTNISCCDISDGRILEQDEWDLIDGKYIVYPNGVRLEVPDERILHGSANPTGKAVAFIRNGRVLCFVPGALF